MGKSLVKINYCSNADCWNLVSCLFIRFSLCVQLMLFQLIRKWEKLISNMNYFFKSSIQSLVLAGLGDLSRPANQLSIGQSISLFATGCIWSRYSLVIIPKNYSLFSVNVFVALTQLIQLTRAYNYAREQEALAKASETAAVAPKSNWMQNEHISIEHQEYRCMHKIPSEIFAFILDSNVIRHCIRVRKLCKFLFYL